jgi:hypothetical protein
LRAALVAAAALLCLTLEGAALPTRSGGTGAPTAPTASATACHPASGSGAGLGSPVPVAAARVASRPAAPDARILVDVYAHVVRSASRGGVPRPRVRRQIRVLNRAFAGREAQGAATSPFRFRLAGVDVTVNQRWYRMAQGSVAEQHAKRSLRRGGGSDLNLYVAAIPSGLGWGTQPTRYAGEPRLDGIVVARHTLPGGRRGRYSAGDAAVHETGHWLGLFHTFTGRCSKRGDLVADTPREARPSYDCHVRRNTCKAPGWDPVHNFMDYGQDACMNRFTRGQVARMESSWQRFRTPETVAADA